MSKQYYVVAGAGERRYQVVEQPLGRKVVLAPFSSEGAAMRALLSLERKERQMKWIASAAITLLLVTLMVAF